MTIGRAGARARRARARRPLGGGPSAAAPSAPPSAAAPRRRPLGGPSARGARAAGARAARARAEAPRRRPLGGGPSASHSRFPESFGLPGPKYVFFIFMIFLYDQYFLYKPRFLSSQPFKTLKIELTISKSTQGISYSSFRPPGTPFRPGLPPKIVLFRRCFAIFDLCSPYVTLF